MKKELESWKIMTEEIADKEIKEIRERNEAKYKRAQAKVAKAEAVVQAAQDEAERLVRLEDEEIRKFNDEKAAKLSALAEERKLKEEELKALDESMKFEKTRPPIRIDRKDWARKFSSFDLKGIKAYIKTHPNDDFTEYLESTKVVKK